MTTLTIKKEINLKKTTYRDEFELIKAILDYIKTENTSLEDDWDEMTPKNLRAYKQAKKELENGEAVSLDQLRRKYL